MRKLILLTTLLFSGAKLFGASGGGCDDATQKLPSEAPNSLVAPRAICLPFCHFCEKCMLNSDRKEGAAFISTFSVIDNLGWSYCSGCKDRHEINLIKFHSERGTLSGRTLAMLFDQLEIPRSNFKVLRNGKHLMSVRRAYIPAYMQDGWNFHAFHMSRKPAKGHFVH